MEDIKINYSISPEALEAAQRALEKLARDQRLKINITVGGFRISAQWSGDRPRKINLEIYDTRGP